MVPPLPPLPPVLAQQRAAARRRLSDALAEADPVVTELLKMLEHRIVIDAIAGVGAPVVAPAGPALAPARRRFLTPEQAQRQRGAAAGVRVVDDHVEAVRTGAVPVLDAAVLRVLHAVTTDSAGPAVPGRYRTGPSRWTREDEPVEHPPADSVEPLADGIIDVCCRAPADQLELAAWAAFATMSIHPFADGNGRVARLLTLLLTSLALEGRTTSKRDGRMIEWWSVDRAAYVAALRAGQPRLPYSGESRDAGPFAVHAAESDIAASEVALSRLAMLTSWWGADPLADLDEVRRAVVLRALVDGWVVGGEVPAVLLDELCSAGWLARPAGLAGVERPDRATLGTTAFVAGPSVPEPMVEAVRVARRGVRPRPSPTL